MKISRSTGYALLAMGYIAKNKEKNITLSSEISEAYDIPLAYLLKIMLQLARANILKSKRGPRGGFSLVKPSNKITMLEIIEAIEGPMSGMALFDETPDKKYCNKANTANEKAINQAKAVYEKTMLSDLMKA